MSRWREWAGLIALALLYVAVQLVTILLGIWLIWMLLWLLA